MRESKPNEATQYLHRAVEAEPTAWRAHAALANACLRQGVLDECINQAERANWDTVGLSSFNRS